MPTSTAIRHQSGFEIFTLRSESLELAVVPELGAKVISLKNLRNGREIRLQYRLTNLSDQPQPYLWAMHPLLGPLPDDRLELPDATRSLLAGEPWIDSLDFADHKPACAKAFAAPLHEGRAGIVNAVSGDRLAFLWDARENDTLGLWLTRGGWNGHHHLALEPTNGQPDSHAVAVEPHQCGNLPPRKIRTWAVRIALEP